MQYQYDSLKRLTTATTTGPQWGQSFGYDGFGNMLSQTVTKDSVPSLSILVNPANNRITTSGFSYDANGNLTAVPNLTMDYDIENRLKGYVYDPSRQRVGKGLLVYFYVVDGRLMGTYGDGYSNPDDYNGYFAGEQIWAEAAAFPHHGQISCITLVASLVCRWFS